MAEFIDMIGLGLQDSLHAASTILLIPTMVVLVTLLLYAVFSIGSIVVEVIIERRHFKAFVPGLIAQVEQAAPEAIPAIIEGSGMLLVQKRALSTVAENMAMSAPDLYALAKCETSYLQTHYATITKRDDTIAKVAPMVGLMGTLIPLGPGIVAMGQGQTQMLASSLLIAFDTTVAGLVCAAVVMVVSTVRKTWYKRYMDAVAASMAAIIDKAEALRTGREHIVRSDVMAAAEAVSHVRAKQIAHGIEQSARTARPAEPEPAFAPATTAVSQTPAPAAEAAPASARAQRSCDPQWYTAARAKAKADPATTAELAPVQKATSSAAATAAPANGEAEPTARSSSDAASATATSAASEPAMARSAEPVSAHPATETVQSTERSDAPSHDDASATASSAHGEPVASEKAAVERRSEAHHGQPSVVSAQARIALADQPAEADEQYSDQVEWLLSALGGKR